MTKRRRELREPGIVPTLEARCAVEVYPAIIILLAAALQNFEIATMFLLGLNARVTLLLLVAISYLLGAATGGRLFAPLRRTYEGFKAQDDGLTLGEQAGKSPVQKSQSLVLSVAC
jgi:hypothetical protein